MVIHKGWKVLSPGRWSVYVKSVSTGAVQYPLGKWVRPQPGCGPLAVFLEEVPARNFAASQSRYPRRICSVHRCEFTYSQFRHLWRFFRGKLQKPRNVLNCTRFASAVRTLD
jgi:hypothetical protein